MVKEDIEIIKRAIEKPEGLDYLYSLLIESGLTHRQNHGMWWEYL
jgi:hypothetical protein